MAVRDGCFRDTIALLDTSRRKSMAAHKILVKVATYINMRNIARTSLLTAIAVPDCGGSRACSPDHVWHAEEVTACSGWVWKKQRPQLHASTQPGPKKFANHTWSCRSGMAAHRFRPCRCCITTPHGAPLWLRGRQHTLRAWRACVLLPNTRQPLQLSACSEAFGHPALV